MLLSTAELLLPSDALSKVTYYLDYRSLIAILCSCMRYYKYKNVILTNQVNFMLDYLKMSLYELPNIGINILPNSPIVETFKQLRNFLYVRLEKFVTENSRNVNGKTVTYSVETYVISSTIYNKFFPGIFPDDYPLFIRISNIRHLKDMIEYFKNNITPEITFFATFKLKGKFNINTRIFELYDNENKLLNLDYLEILKCLKIYDFTKGDNKNAVIFTLSYVNIYEMCIRFSTINDAYERRQKLFKKIRETYTSTYLIDDSFK
jgi:hypothetical protein